MGGSEPWVSGGWCGEAKDGARSRSRSWELGVGVGARLGDGQKRFTRSRPMASSNRRVGLGRRAMVLHCGRGAGAQHAIVCSASGRCKRPKA